MNCSNKVADKAYIILAHKNPEQVSRLIAALDDNHSWFFLHVDKRANDFSIEDIKAKTDRLIIIESIATEWAGFGLVEATLNSMKAAAIHKQHFDFFLLISGQHYPVRSNAYINDYLCSSPFRIFIDYTGIPDYKRWKVSGGLYRINKYFLGTKIRERYTAKLLNFLSSAFSVLKRKFPKNMKPYGGSQWWIIDAYALQYILDFVNKNPDYLAFYKYTFAADELFFQNILLNAKDEKIQSGITSNNLLYMKWPDSNAAHPDILQSSDIENIFTSGALFARKFDVQKDANVLVLIDKNRVCKVQPDTSFSLQISS